jgi:ABC-type nitrate/sulfonate/bicarbonate transport system substrate-binding protein
LTRTVCRFVLLAIAIVAVSALTVVGGAAAATSGGSAAKSGVREANITITFGETALQAGYWPLYIAQTKGFFAAQKLNVTTLVTQNSANDTAAVLSGSLLVSSGTPDGVCASKCACVQSHRREEHQFLGRSERPTDRCFCGDVE